MHKHPLQSIGFRYVGLDHVTRGGKSYMISTICHIETNLYETAINSQPEERYSNLKDAERGHRRYLDLLREGWIPSK